MGVATGGVVSVMGSLWQPRLTFSDERTAAQPRPHIRRDTGTRTIPYHRDHWPVAVIVIPAGPRDCGYGRHAETATLSRIKKGLRPRMTPRMLFRTAAIAEAITWTLLITALIVRAVTGFALGVSIAGGIHGFVFLTYGATAVLLAINQRWHAGIATTAVGSAIIPYATIPVELWLARTRRLDGEWRRRESDDPRDRTWFDRLARWFIRHPVLLIVAIAAAVVVLFVVLLSLGPPQLPGKG